MRIDILVVIAIRKVSMLSGKSLTTFVTLARPAKTVAAPVLERTEDAEKRFVGRRNCSAFSQGYVVRGVEAESR